MKDNNKLNRHIVNTAKDYDMDYKDVEKIIKANPYTYYIQLEEYIIERRNKK